MADDYGSMQSRIADELARSDLTTQIALAIQTAIKRHERERFYFNTKTGTFSTVAAQEYYAAAANSDIPNISKIERAKVTVDGYKYDLVASTFDSIDDEQDGTITGDPTHFAYFAQQVRLYPIPNAIRTVTMAYVYRLSSLSDSADANAWMTDGEELIRQTAKGIVAADVISDEAMMMRAGALESGARGRLLAETRKRITIDRMSLDSAMTGGSRSNILRG